MSIKIEMPDLPEISESGVLSNWLISAGDAVSAGTPIAEIETDKALIELESPEQGIVGKLLVEAGPAPIPIGTTIAILLQDGETLADLDTDDSTNQSSKLQSSLQSDLEPPKETDEVSDSSGETQSRPRPKASPRIKRLASTLGVDLDSVHGSGPEGRILERDLTTQASTSSASADTPSDLPAHKANPLSKMRMAIAERMSKTNAAVPSFFVLADVELDAVLAARSAYKQNVAAENVRPSINDYILKATALALKAVPEVNSHFGGNAVLQFERADIAFVVAVSGGIVLPVVRSADSKSLTEIARETRKLSEQARNGKLLASSCSGGTFSISNLGMMEVRSFSAIINEPQVAILATGRAAHCAVVRDEVIQTRVMMTCTLSCDHRAIDGMTGARFLAEFRKRIEEPASLE